MAILQTNLRNARVVLGVESQSYKSLQAMIAEHAEAKKERSLQSGGTSVGSKRDSAQTGISLGNLAYRPKS
ncbi:MAG: hypothetical protein M1812_001955 [Candelaria pacifica]|nr:MAG: hypothetical protein M1812_001955 [Candelaria pacifica]